MEWETIDSAPKDDTPVLLYCPPTEWERAYVHSAVWYHREWLIDGSYHCIRDATHWMPLPPPPKD